MWCQVEARRHFDCPILEGMELENQGGTGTELNHWEKRLLEVHASLCFSCIENIRLCLFLFSMSERGHDGLPHTEPGLLPANAGHHGGHGLVPGQLQLGPNAGLGPSTGLRFRHEELQVLDGPTETEVKTRPTQIMDAESIKSDRVFDLLQTTQSDSVL